MEIEQPKKNANLLKNAQNDKQRGLSELKTCALCFKCSPSYETAIPFLKNAATGFNALSDIKEEIECRNHLIDCFRYIKSFWEEGNELEKVAYLQLKGLNNPNDALISIQNSHLAYYNKGDYQEATNCVHKLSLVFKELKYMDHAEKALAVNYNSSLKYGHVVLSKEDDLHDYIYKSFNTYFGVLIANDKTTVAIESTNNLIKSLEAHENDKSEILNLYLLLACGKIINEDSNVESILDKAKEYSSDRSDNSRINSIRSILNAVIKGDEKIFNDNSYEAFINFDNEVVKKIKVTLDKNSSGDKNNNDFLGGGGRISKIKEKELEEEYLGNNKNDNINNKEIDNTHDKDDEFL